MTTLAQQKAEKLSRQVHFHQVAALRSNDERQKF